ncbi:MAG: tetratricopeptide repeat protein [Fimbriimonadaceae bacterium]|nr:tetratricopeptide repeat protein [Fimbriimonadaceae bacterium]QYK58380.1 MAG: tetratricopeptide repeat protein [Fimbriimonadaceae bacterium]
MTVDELFEQGFAFRCEGRYREAREALEQALRLNPFHVKSRWQMALILGFEGDFDGSLDALRALAFEEPDNIDVKNDLAMTYMMLGYMEEACAEFRGILAIDPSHENARRQMVYC